MILTVTLNAALDITYRVPRLRPSATNRVAAVSERPGGKGLNVARVLAALGHRAVVAGFAGGRTGAVLREGLAAPGGTGDRGMAGDRGIAGDRRTDGPGAAGARTADGNAASAPGTERDRPGSAGGCGAVIDALTPIAGATRRTIGVVDDASGDTTQLNEPGPTIDPAEWAAFLGTYTDLLTEARAVALCGSLPPGLSVGSYAELVRKAQAAGIPVLLDTSGEPLRRGIAARPDLVKPNAAELTGLTGSTEPVRAARDARRRGARAVAASLGPAGMLVVTPEGSWQAAPPGEYAGNPTGAGDAAVAGLLSALIEGLPWPDRLARAVALSAATVLAATAGEFEHGVYEDLLARIDVTAQPSAA